MLARLGRADAANAHLAAALKLALAELEHGTSVTAFGGAEFDKQKLSVVLINSI